MKTQLKIQRKGGRGNVAAWTDDGEYYIREAIDRGRDVQTVCLTRGELTKILTLEHDSKEPNTTDGEGVEVSSTP